MFGIAIRVQPRFDFRNHLRFGTGSGPDRFCCKLLSIQFCFEQRDNFLLLPDSFLCHTCNSLIRGDFFLRKPGGLLLQSGTIFRRLSSVALSLDTLFALLSFMQFIVSFFSGET